MRIGGQFRTVWEEEKRGEKSRKEPERARKNSSAFLTLF